MQPSVPVGSFVDGVALVDEQPSKHPTQLRIILDEQQPEETAGLR
jgi:hypothetical protein